MNAQRKPCPTPKRFDRGPQRLKNCPRAVHPDEDPHDLLADHRVADRGSRVPVDGTGRADPTQSAQDDALRARGSAEPRRFERRTHPQFGFVVVDTNERSHRPDAGGWSGGGLAERDERDVAPFPPVGAVETVYDDDPVGRRHLGGAWWEEVTRGDEVGQRAVAAEPRSGAAADGGRSEFVQPFGSHGSRPR